MESNLSTKEKNEYIDESRGPRPELGMHNGKYSRLLEEYNTGWNDGYEMGIRDQISQQKKFINVSKQPPAEVKEDLSELKRTLKSMGKKSGQAILFGIKVLVLMLGADIFYGINTHRRRKTYLYNYNLYL